MEEKRLNLELKITDREIMLKDKAFVDKSKVKEESNPLTILSYPRSGNTMLRTIVENASNIFTGDDMFFPEEVFKAREKTSLSYLGVGKESTVKNVSFIKSHFPLMNFPQNSYNTQGIILAVRNPFDAIESFIHFEASSNHSNCFEGEFKPDVLQNFCDLCIPKYEEFHEQVINNMIGKVPIYFIVYEDFNKDKVSGTKDLFDFVFKFDLDKEYLGGQTSDDIKKRLNSETEIVDIIEKVIYLPKDEKNKFKAIKEGKLLSNEIKEKIITDCYSSLKFFGYIKDLKDLKDEVVTKALEKMEALEKEDNSVYKFKYASYKQIEEINQKLFDGFSQYDKQIKRPSVLINEQDENKFNLLPILLENYWHKLTK